MKNSIDKFKDWSELYNNKIKDSGYEFNIFNLMKKESDEVCLHSNFIANLLSPNGSHNMGYNFLNKFKERYYPDFELNEQDGKCAITVEVEHYVGKIDNDSEDGGRIDIFVKNHKGQKFIIENKIYASDQNLQLIRYHNAYKDAKIFYLTLFGDEPCDKSVLSDKIKLINGQNFECISYKSDIINWIESVIRDQNDNNTNKLFNSTCIQYLNTLKKLTNQLLFEDMENELDKIVTENFSKFLEIESVLPKIKLNIQRSFWNEMKMTLEKELPNQKPLKTVNVENYYLPRKNSEKDFGIYFDICELNDGYKLKIGCLLDHNLYYAVKLFKGDNEISLNDDKEKFKHYRNAIAKNLSFEEDGSALVWSYTTPKINFKEFNSDESKGLADPENLKQVAKKISDGMICIANQIKKIDEIKNPSK